MQITFLGTGTSQGVPVIGCPCKVCTSADPRDTRLRTSLYLTHQGTALNIDAGPDFRQQILAQGIRHLDAILLTHEHNDHVMGLDDVRPFNFMTRKPMPLFGEERVLDEVRKRFSYAFDEQPYPGAPSFKLIPISPNVPFRVGNLEVLPFRVWHGENPVLGFRIEDFTYITDMKTLPGESLPLVSGTNYLVVNALHHEAHPTHMNLHDALQFIHQVNPRKAWLIHMSHRMGQYTSLAGEMPDNVHVAYDGLTQSLEPNP